MHIPACLVQTCGPRRSCNLQFFLFAPLSTEQGVVWLQLGVRVHLGPMQPGFSARAPCAKASEKQIALLHLEKALILVLLFIFHALDPGSLQRHDHGEGSGDREPSRSPGGCSRRELLL